MMKEATEKLFEMMGRELMACLVGLDIGPTHAAILRADAIRHELEKRARAALSSSSPETAPATPSGPWDTSLDKPWHWSSWLDCPWCRPLSKSGAKPPRCAWHQSKSSETAPTETAEAAGPDGDPWCLPDADGHIACGHCRDAAAATSEAPKPSDDQLDDMRHALGRRLDDLYRNHFCCEIGGDVEVSWDGLCKMGLAKRGQTINDGRDAYFSVTPVGLELLRSLARHTKRGEGK
jgi:hypothetical protein